MAQQQRSHYAEQPNPAVACCVGKFPFPSWDMANKVMKARSRSRGLRRVYRCKCCRFWHLG